MTPRKRPARRGNPIVSSIDRMPEPTAFKIETAKKSKEGLDLEVGLSRGVETFVLIETDEPPQVIARMVEVAKKACVAAQTVVNAAPASTVFISHGERIQGWSTRFVMRRFLAPIVTRCGALVVTQSHTRLGQSSSQPCNLAPTQLQE